MMIGQYLKQEARKPIQVSQPLLSILVQKRDSSVTKLCKRGIKLRKSLVCDSVFSVISWYGSQFRTLSFPEIDFILYEVGISSHEASRGSPHHLVCSVSVFPESQREDVGWERLDEYAIIMPYKVNIDILDNNNAAALSGLEVEQGDLISLNSALYSQNCIHLPHFAHFTAT
jgi:hypothetical protein